MVGEVIDFKTCSFPIYGKYSSGQIVKFMLYNNESGKVLGVVVFTTHISSAGYISSGWDQREVVEIESDSAMLNVECMQECNKNCNNCPIISNQFYYGG